MKLKKLVTFTSSVAGSYPVEYHLVSIDVDTIYVFILGKDEIHVETETREVVNMLHKEKDIMFDNVLNRNISDYDLEEFISGVYRIRNVKEDGFYPDRYYTDIIRLENKRINQVLSIKKELKKDLAILLEKHNF